jgi:hypothetical protein
MNPHAKLGGDYFCEICNSWHGTALGSCCKNFGDYLDIKYTRESEEADIPTINTLIQVSKGFFMMPHQLDAAKKEAEAMISYIENKQLKTH